MCEHFGACHEDGVDGRHRGAERQLRAGASFGRTRQRTKHEHRGNESTLSHHIRDIGTADAATDSTRNPMSGPVGTLSGRGERNERDLWLLLLSVRPGADCEDTCRDCDDGYAPHTHLQMGV